MHKIPCTSCPHFQALAFADGVNILGESIQTVQRNTAALVAACKEIGLEINAEKTKYVFVSQEQNAEQNHNIKIGNKSLERVEQFKYLETTLTGQYSIHEEINSRLKSGNACYHLVQCFMSFSLLCKNWAYEGCGNGGVEKAA